MPDYWGVLNYHVIENEVQYELSWDDVQMRVYERPPHLYNRFERFSAILNHLIGGGSVPDEYVELVDDHLEEFDEEKIWLATEKILKKYGGRKYVNRIPFILKELGYGDVMVGEKKTSIVLMHFLQMSERFDEIKWKLYMEFGIQRTYFPCLRYTALRLLDLHGNEFSYSIPLIKTPCKVDRSEC